MTTTTKITPRITAAFEQIHRMDNDHPQRHPVHTAVETIRIDDKAEMERFVELYLDSKRYIDPFSKEGKQMESARKDIIDAAKEKGKDVEDAWSEAFDKVVIRRSEDQLKNEARTD